MLSARCIRKITFSIVLTSLFLGSAVLSGRAEENYEPFLDKVQRQAFDYFWEETDAKTGFTRNTTEKVAPASNAAAGYMLSSLIIGIERGWITKEHGYARALITLKSFEKMKNFHGFTYHYFSIFYGDRMWASEVSCIDQAIFLAGVITIGEYFKGTEVERLADEIYRRTDWQWFLNGENVLQMAWKPERGFFARIDTFSEGILCYILAMGSPRYPIPKECWDAFARPVTRYKTYRLVYSRDGGLFQYLLPMAWLDLRDKHDKYVDYWQNAIKAVKANKQYCKDNADEYKTYREGLWGLSACLGPSGYVAYGAKPGNNTHDGTVAPCAIGGSIPLTPEFSLADYRLMHDYMRIRNPAAIKKYGLVDAFNLDREWTATEYLAIDKGLTLLMIENYRTGLIWKYFMQNKYVQKGLEKAGFMDGRQYHVSDIAYLAGNPYDLVMVEKIDKEININALLSEWKDATRLVLTGKNNRNVEITLGYIKDDADLSGIFHLGWDDEYFYVGGDIKDNQIVCGQADSKIFLDDCVEIFFDTNQDGYYFDGNPYDYQLGIAPSGPDGHSQIWAWGYRNAKPANVRYSIFTVGEGYVFEAAIPFTEIKGFDPYEEEEIFFSVSIHDRDKNDKVGKLTWSIDSASKPETIYFGTLILVD